MGHPGNWSERKRAAETARLARWLDEHWPEPRPDPSILPALLRPHDTMRLGWTQTVGCLPCGGLTVFHCPSDLRKCNWAYVLELTHCRTCRAPVDGFFFSGPRDPATGNVKRMGSVQRTG